MDESNVSRGTLCVNGAVHDYHTPYTLPNGGSTVVVCRRCADVQRVEAPPSPNKAWRGPAEGLTEPNNFGL